jgi:hypothetical protein
MAKRRRNEASQSQAATDLKSSSSLSTAEDSLAKLQAECMDAPPLMAWSDFEHAQSLFHDSRGRVLLSGHCKADWLQHESQAPGIDKVFVPTGLAAAVPNVRSVASMGTPIVLTEDGKVFLNGGKVATRVPRKTVRLLSAGDDTIFAATKDGGMYWWSTNHTQHTIPTTPSVHEKGSLGRAKVRFVCTNGSGAFAVGDNGRLVSWGSGSCLGLDEDGMWGGDEPVLAPAPIDALEGVVICSVAAGVGVALALSATGDVYAWGSLVKDKCGMGFLPAQVQELGGTPVGAIAAGGDSCCAITRIGHLYTWGEGKHGNLGHGDTANQSKPKLVEALRGVPLVAVSASGVHTIAAARGGQVGGRSRPIPQNLERLDNWAKGLLLSRPPGPIARPEPY